MESSKTSAGPGTSSDSATGSAPKLATKSRCPAELARSIEKIPWMPGSTLADDIAESVMAYASKAGHSTMNERLSQQSQLEAERLDWMREHFYRGLQDLRDVFQALPGKRVLVVASAGFPMTVAGTNPRQLGGFTPEFKELSRLIK